MLMIVWEYMVRKDKEAEFEALYRPDGAWAAFLRRSPAFGGTTLTRDARDRHRYLIADRWESEQAYDEFKREFAVEYQELDEQGRRLHRAEHLIGRFEEVSA